MITREATWSTQEEIKKAEAIMTDEQQEKSERRQHNLGSSYFLLQRNNRDNKALFRAALDVYKENDILRYGSEEVKNDNTIVVAAVQKYGASAFQYASRERRSDVADVARIVQLAPCAYVFSTGEARNNKAVILAAIDGCGDMLQYVPPPHRDDFDVLYTAFRQDITSIRHASPEGRNKLQKFINEFL